MITAEERKLIDEAVKAGKVSKVAMGKSSFPEIVWDGHRLVYDIQDGDSMPFKWNTRKNRKNFKRTLERRAKVKALYDEGKTNAEIAEILKSNPTTISGDCRELGIVGHRAPSLSKAHIKAIDDRRARVLEILKEGKLSRTQAAREVGCSVSTVKADAAFLGMSFDRHAPGRKGTSKTVQKRRQRILREVENGLTQVEIVAKLGLSQSTISLDFRAIGLGRRRMAAE